MEGIERARAVEAAARELVDCLRECADALAAEVNDRYRYRDTYASELRRYERDMQPVNRARRAAEALDAALQESTKHA